MVMIGNRGLGDGNDRYSDTLPARSSCGFGGVSINGVFPRILTVATILTHAFPRNFE